MDDAGELAAFARELAKAARAETLTRWIGGCPVENKGDGAFDPVTDADREAERVMRRLINERYPDHGVIGEEWPDAPGSGSYCWSLDPIDGTRSFICGLPTWTTLIAFMDDCRPLMGLVDAPCLEETYLGFDGQAMLLRKGEQTAIHASACTRIADARLSTTDPFLFDDAARDAFDRLRRKVVTVRFGHDGYAYARVAAGSLDLVVEEGLKPHDYRPIIPLVEAAGGVVGDWRGGKDFKSGRIIAAATRSLFEEALGYFESVE